MTLNMLFMRSAVNQAFISDYKGDLLHPLLFWCAFSRVLYLYDNRSTKSSRKAE